VRTLAPLVSHLSDCSSWSSAYLRTSASSVPAGSSTALSPILATSAPFFVLVLLIMTLRTQLVVYITNADISVGPLLKRFSPKGLSARLGGGLNFNMHKDWDLLNSRNATLAAAWDILEASVWRVVATLGCVHELLNSAEVYREAVWLNGEKHGDIL